MAFSNSKDEKIILLDTNFSLPSPAKTSQTCIHKCFQTQKYAHKTSFQDIPFIVLYLFKIAFLLFSLYVFFLLYTSNLARYLQSSSPLPNYQHPTSSLSSLFYILSPLSSETIPNMVLFEYVKVLIEYLKFITA